MTLISTIISFVVITISVIMMNNGLKGSWYVLVNQEQPTMTCLKANNDSNHQAEPVDPFKHFMSASRAQFSGMGCSLAPVCHVDLSVGFLVKVSPVPD